MFFTSLEMVVNITQYLGSVGIFNNRNFIFRPKFTHFIDHKCWSTNHLYFKLHFSIFTINLVLFLVFVIVVFSPGCSFYIVGRNTCTPVPVITAALLFDYQWFKCNLLLLCSDAELNPGPKQNTAKKFSHKNVL